MSKKKRKFSAEFKAKVALDALSGEQSLAELSSKYEVHAKGKELRQELARWFEFYNTRRPHFAFDGQKPMTVYRNDLKPEGLLPRMRSEAA